MIKTYPDQAAFDAAEKSKMESTVGLLENTGKVVLNGVNVITDQPKVGDIACYDENRKIVFIQCDTYQGGTFPSAWETLGVVVIRKGNQVTICSKHNESKKFMEVLSYVVSGYQLDGTEHTVTVNFYGTEAKEFKYTASTDEEFLSDLKNFLTDNGLSGWSAYIMDGKVILQLNDFSTESSRTTSEGLTLTARLEIDVPKGVNPLRRCGSVGWAVWNAGTIKKVYSSDLQGTANPSTDVSTIPSYPVCWPAFAGTSQYQSDHCQWLRQQYCKDPNHPKKEEWEAYIDDMVIDVPAMTGGAGLEYRNGRILTDLLKEKKYESAAGEMKSLYTGVVYCSDFMSGRGYFPSMSELEEAFGELTYTPGEESRDKSDAINRSLYAIGGNSINANASIRTMSRTDDWSLRYFGPNGFVDGWGAAQAFRVIPFADIDLSEINE